MSSTQAAATDECSNAADKSNDPATHALTTSDVRIHNEAAQQTEVPGNPSPNGHVSMSNSDQSNDSLSDNEPRDRPASKLITMLRCCLPATRAVMDLGRRRQLRNDAHCTMETLISSAFRPAVGVARHTAPHPRNKDSDPAAKLIVDAHLGSREGVQRSVDALTAAHRDLSNVRDGTGGSALHRAAQQGHIDTCTMLMQLGLSPSLPSWSTGDTPVHEAARGGKKETLLALLSKEPSAASIGNRRGALPIMESYRRGHTECIRVLASFMEPAVVTSLFPGGVPGAAAPEAPPPPPAATPLPLRVPYSPKVPPQQPLAPRRLVRLPCEKQRIFTISALEAIGGRSAIEQLCRSTSPQFMCRWRPASSLTVVSYPLQLLPQAGQAATNGATTIRVARWCLLLTEILPPPIIVHPGGKSEPQIRQPSHTSISRSDAVKALRSITEALDNFVGRHGGYDCVSTADTLPEYTASSMAVRCLAGGGGGTARNYGPCAASCVAKMPSNVFNSINSYVYCGTYRNVYSNVVIDGHDRFGCASLGDASAMERAKMYQDVHREVCQRLDRCEEYCYVVESPLQQLSFAFPSVVLQCGIHETHGVAWIEMRGSNAKELELFYDKLAEMAWCSDRRVILPPFQFVATSQSLLGNIPSCKVLPGCIPAPNNSMAASGDLLAKAVGVQDARVSSESNRGLSRDETQRSTSVGNSAENAPRPNPLPTPVANQAAPAYSISGQRSAAPANSTVNQSNFITPSTIRLGHTTLPPPPAFAAAPQTVSYPTWTQQKEPQRQQHQAQYQHQQQFWQHQQQQQLMAHQQAVHPPNIPGMQFAQTVGPQTIRQAPFQGQQWVGNGPQRDGRMAQQPGTNGMPMQYSQGTPVMYAPNQQMQQPNGYAVQQMQYYAVQQAQQMQQQQQQQQQAFQMQPGGMSPAVGTHSPPQQQQQYSHLQANTYTPQQHVQIQPSPQAAPVPTTTTTTVAASSIWESTTSTTPEPRSAMSDTTMEEYLRMNAMLSEIFNTTGSS